MDVWLVQVKSPNAPGLKPAKQPSNTSNMWNASGSRYEVRNEPLNAISGMIEFVANVPVMDKTGLTRRFDCDFNCLQADVENRNWDKVNQALDQLGLELVPGRESIEMLVIEK